ncbi:hypothetical protein [Pseudomonas aeruginosa]|nr:hypothetical protein [Pseudomonas aeruginosa]
MNEGNLIPTTFLAISPQEAEEQARNNLSIIGYPDFLVDWLIS